MTPDSVVQIVRHLLITSFWLAAPLLAIGFVAGILVSLAQIATSMQDSAFSAVPRIIAFLVGVLLFLPLMIEKSMGYATSILGDLGRYAR